MTSTYEQRCHDDGDIDCWLEYAASSKPPPQRHELTSEQVSVLEKHAFDKAWAARDLSKCKCNHNETCEHCLPPNLIKKGQA